MCDVPCRVYAASLVRLHRPVALLLSLAYSCWWCRASRLPRRSSANGPVAWRRIAEWAGAKGVDLRASWTSKHAYNKTRPYRHGGKAL